LVTKHRDEHPAGEELNISERARLKELEHENRELRMERDFLKSRSLLREGTMSEKYALIAAEKADSTSVYPVVKMCTWLEVSTSGFYDHLDAEPSARRCAGPRSSPTSRPPTLLAVAPTGSAGSTPS
jgi:putative transposase